MVFDNLANVLVNEPHSLFNVFVTCIEAEAETDRSLGFVSVQTNGP